MNRARVAELLHTAVYQVLRHSPPLPAVEAFLAMPLGSVLTEGAPGEWPSFWEEVLVATLKDLFRREGFRIDRLSTDLFAQRERTLLEIRDWIADHLMPLTVPPGGGGPAEPPHSARRLSLLIVLCALACHVPVTFAASPSSSAMTAILEETPGERPEGAIYHHDILIEFGSADRKRIELPVAMIVGRERYAIHSTCDPEQPVWIDRIYPYGVGERDSFFVGAVLYADLDPACQYLVRVSMPGQEQVEIEVGRPAETEAPRGFGRLTSFIDRHASGTIDVRTLADRADRVGLDVRAAVDFPAHQPTPLADAIRCRLSANGMFTVREAPHDAPDGIDLGVTMSWLKRYMLPGPWRGLRQVHAVGLQFTPLGLECDQRWDLIDYKLTPAVTFSVPFVDWPLQLWSRAIALQRGFTPPTVRVGYAYLRRLKPHDAPEPDFQRIDLEVCAIVPVLRRLDLVLRRQVHHDLEQETRREMTELSWKWYVDAKGAVGMLLKFVHGSLPPAYRDADMVGVGFSVGL